MKTTLKSLIPITLGCFLTGECSAQTVYAVSADKMNVFYIGLDNPVSIAVAGIPADKISVSMDGGTITGEKGKYIVRTSVGGQALIKIFSASENGKKDSIGSVAFRVKPVPSPVATIYGKRGTDIIKQGEIQFLSGVVPVLDNFEFDLKFPVVSFDVSMPIENDKGEKIEVTESAEGSSLNEKQKALLKRAKIGSKIYIEKVKVKKPGGQVVVIGSVNLKVVE